MITIDFLDKKFVDIPEGYDEMKIGHYMEILSIIEKKDEYKNEFEFSLDILSKLIGCDRKVLLKLNRDEIYELTGCFLYLKETPSKKTFIEFTMDGVKYGLTKFPLLVEEEISIETILTQGKKESDILHLLIAILIRPVENDKIVELDEWDDLQKRAELFKDKLYLEDVYGAVMVFTDGVKKSFSGNTAPFSRLNIKKGKVNS
jgi:hypothetical protein